jgi:hypothetical protein
MSENNGSSSLGNGGERHSLPGAPLENSRKNDRSPDPTLSGPPQVAQFPKGFWKRVDYLLHNPDRIRESLLSDTDLWDLSKVLFVISLAMAVIYGAVMGATNLLQGSPAMTMGQKLLMILVTGIKVPVLYLLTLLIVFPPVYVLNAFVGARLEFRQMLTLLLSSVAITVTVLSSMATVAFFFALTSRSYDFIKLLHVLFFVYAGLAGLAYLAKTVKSISFINKRPTPRWLFIFWLLLYMFVGTQLAWVLRPFVGSPDLEFRLFRPRSGNFYESVIDSLHEISSGTPPATQKGLSATRENPNPR